MLQKFDKEFEIRSTDVTTHSDLAYKDLPNDNISRVVWWYGGIVKNTSPNSTVPLIEVLFRELSDDDIMLVDAESYSVIKIPVSALDGFKIGTIWKNRKEIGLVWDIEHYSEEIETREIELNLANNMY